MKELLLLNKKHLIKSYLWSSGILTFIFSIYLYFFHLEISFKFITIIYLSTIIILPSFIIIVWTSDWFRKRKYLTRILKQKPYSELSKIGFNKKTIVSNHNSLVDYVLFTEINDCEIVFNVDLNKSKIAEFKIYANTEFTKLSYSEYSNELKLLKTHNIDYEYSGFTKRINTRKEKFNSIQELEKTLLEFTNIVKKYKYEPILISEWEKV